MAHGITYQPQLCEIIEMEEIRDGDVVAESPCDVTPERDTEEDKGEKQSAAVQKWLRRFGSGCSGYVPVTLFIFSLTSLIIIIVLAAQLSLVNQQHDETSITLEMLRQEHGHEETLRQTNNRLEMTENDLLKIREEQKTTNQNLERRMHEKVETATTMIKPEDSLWNMGPILQENINELIRCLKSVNSQMADSTVSRMNSSLSKNRQKMKIKVSSLSKKETEMCATRRGLQQFQRHLQERNSQKQLKMLNNLEERLSEMEDNLRKLEEKLSKQEERLGDDMKDSELHPSTICPGGWRQIQEMCYYFSSENNVRLKADEDCRKRSSSLAKIEENNFELKAMVENDGRSFWIGLRKDTNLWTWSDNSLQTNFQPKTRDWCAKASPELMSLPCSTNLPWICQKKARTYS